MGKINIDPYIKSLTRSFTSKKDDALEAVATELIEHGRKGSGVANLQLIQAFKEAFKEAHNECLIELFDLFKDTPNKPALVACDEYRESCDRLIDVQAKEFINGAIKIYGSIKQEQREESENTLFNLLTLLLKEYVSERMNVVRSKIEARNNPLWNKPLMRWFDRISWLIIGAGITLLISFIITRYIDKPLNTNSSSAEQSAEVKTPVASSPVIDSGQPAPKDVPKPSPETEPVVNPPSPAPGSDPAQENNDGE